MASGGAAVHSPCQCCSLGLTYHASIATVSPSAGSGSGTAQHARSRCMPGEFAGNAGVADVSPHGDCGGGSATAAGCVARGRRFGDG